jgi:hypothetical protein
MELHASPIPIISIGEIFSFHAMREKATITTSPTAL